MSELNVKANSLENSGKSEEFDWYQPCAGNRFKCLVCFKEYAGNFRKAKKHAKSVRHNKIKEIRKFEHDLDKKPEVLSPPVEAPIVFQSIEEIEKKIDMIDKDFPSDSKNPENVTSHHIKDTSKKSPKKIKSITKITAASEWVNFQINNSNLINYLYKNSDSQCDVVLRSRNGEIKAHKLILASACNFFREIFQSSIHFEIQKETVILFEDYNLEILKMLVEFFYAGKVLISKENLDEFNSICNVLNLKPITEQSKELCDLTKSTEVPEKPENQDSDDIDLLLESQLSTDIEVMKIKAIQKAKDITIKRNLIEGPSPAVLPETPQKPTLEQSIEEMLLEPTEMQNDSIIENLSNFLNFEGKLLQKSDSENELSNSVPPDLQESTDENFEEPTELIESVTQELKIPTRNKRRNPSEMTLFPPLPMDEESPVAKKRYSTLCKRTPKPKLRQPKKIVVPKIFQNSPHIRAFFESRR